MITKAGELSLITGLVDDRPILPEEELVLELHKRYPDIGNIESVFTASIMEFGGIEEALEAIRNGELELEIKKEKLN